MKGHQIYSLAQQHVQRMVVARRQQSPRTYEKVWIAHGLVTERKGMPITVGMWEAGARWRQGATPGEAVDTTTKEAAARHWEIYTDGSGQQESAGWGYVC